MSVSEEKDPHVGANFDLQEIINIIVFVDVSYIMLHSKHLRYMSREDFKRFYTLNL